MNLRRSWLACACALAALALCAPPTARAQASLENDRRRGLEILDTVKRDIQQNYYDPSFRGRDLEAYFAAAAEKVKQATSMGHALGLISRALTDLNDSHTYFVAPAPADQIQHGWEMRMIGDACYVVAVQKGSDAESQGLRPGDEVLSVHGNTPTRERFWKLLQFTRSVRAIRAVVRSPGGEERSVEVAAKVRKGKPMLDLRGLGSGADSDTLIRESENDAVLRRHRYVEAGADLFIWKMPLFGSEKMIDQMMAKARKSKTIILDLRGNGGGYQSALLRLVGHFFEQDVKVGELKSRKETRPLVARARGAEAYKGRLVVIVDSESGSSAEMFARVVQLEKRGTVIGDRTAGAVMQGTYFGHKSGIDLVFYYGVSVTSADVLMSDGKSLERVGVVPDELLLPTAADLAAGRDPLLSRAATLLGLELDPSKAGEIFPAEWRP